MTGDEINPNDMMYMDKSDEEVATMVRMLYRNQLDHEAVCVGARDRIMYLSQELERARGEIRHATGETDAVLDFMRLIEDVLTQGGPGSRVADALSLVAQALALADHHACDTDRRTPS